jgi:hypothetical protein
MGVLMVNLWTALVDNRGRFFPLDIRGRFFPLQDSKLNSRELLFSGEKYSFLWKKYNSSDESNPETFVRRFFFEENQS